MKKIIIALAALTVMACDARNTEENIRFESGTLVIVGDHFYGRLWTDCYHHDKYCRVGVGGYGHRTVNPEAIKVLPKDD